MMNKIDLENFKNDILFEAIHKEERSRYLWDLIDQAHTISVVKHEPYFDASNCSSFHLYIKIIYNIERMKKLIQVCDDLQFRGYKLQRLILKEDDYYQSIFKGRLSAAKTEMKKLRPYLLKYTKAFTAESRLKVIIDPLLGPYFKGWYNE